jgi:gluconolactonase
LYACDFGIGAILKISPAGKTEIYASGFARKAFNHPNDLAFDASGNLYFTDPKSYSERALDGRVFCVRAKDKTIIKLTDSLGFPNGIAFSPGGKQLYVCESVFGRILRFDVQADGSLHNKQVFVQLLGGDPDGIDIDREGNLYVAHYGGGAVYVIAPDGSIRQKIPAPGKKPTNIEFGGDDLKTLFLTEVETNALYQCRVDIAGTAALVVKR